MYYNMNAKLLASVLMYLLTLSDQLLTTLLPALYIILYFYVCICLIVFLDIEVHQCKMSHTVLLFFEKAKTQLQKDKMVHI